MPGVHFTHKEHKQRKEEVNIVSIPRISLVGLAMKAKGGRPGVDSHFQLRSLSRSSHTSDLKIGNPVATLPGTWHYRVIVGQVGPVSVYYDWVRYKFDLQLLSQCDRTLSCLSRSVPEIH